VNQRCGSNQFIEINDKLEMSDRVFISNNGCGERARQQRDRKRESVRDRELLERRDSVGNKIDCYRKHVAQVCEINK
jgi:hypothetical protein